VPRGTGRANRVAPRTPRLDQDALRTFGTKLRAWYRRHARDLPWRRTRDPYRILVSELMLQQTQVSRVIDFYHRFLDRFPSVEALAKARESQVVAQWEGLGYYARARNLHKVSRAVVREGFPSEADQLRQLPGIGPYTAGAVATFAFERREPLVDTNVARVLTRVFAPKLHPKRARDQKAIWAIAEATLPRTGKAAWTHNQALMELGALICTARVKHCGKCPVRGSCKSRAEG
jgi:A/G-specific adenine glycosylase